MIIKYLFKKADNKGKIRLVVVDCPVPEEISRQQPQDTGGFGSRDRPEAGRVGCQK